MLTTTLLWTFVAYLSGALPLSVWIGRRAGHDIRRHGDHNPGATNVLRAAGWRWGLAALMADVSKAAAPVGTAVFIFGWEGWRLVPIALAPSIGHAYSIFLHGRGGKALATILGAWIGLTLYEMPLVLLPLLTAAFLVQRNDGWSVMPAGLGGLAYLWVWHSDPVLLIIMGLQLLLAAVTHRADLRRPPAFRNPLTRTS